MTTRPPSADAAMDRYLRHAEDTVVAVLTGRPAHRHAQAALAAYAEAAGIRAGQLGQAVEGGRLLEALDLRDPDDGPRVA